MQIWNIYTYVRIFLGQIFVFCSFVKETKRIAKMPKFILISFLKKWNSFFKIKVWKNASEIGLWESFGFCEKKWWWWWWYSTTHPLNRNRARKFWWIFFSKFSYFYGTGKEKFLNKTWIYSISIYILLINFWQKKIVKKEAEGKINITFHIYLSYLTSSDYL